jgi:hypothetical protein
MLLVLHSLPFALLRGVFRSMSIEPAQALMTGVWLTVAILVLTALAAIAAEKRILWEVIIASCAVSVFSIVTFYFALEPAHFNIGWPVVISRSRPPLWAIAFFVPAMSLLGVWFGERIKSVWRIGARPGSDNHHR